MTASTPEEIAERRELLERAKAEHLAIKEARQKGEPIPATPAIDELQGRHENMTSTSKPKTAGEGRSKGRTDIRYFHDGRSMPESHKHKLSTVAYFYSGNLAAGTKRIGTKQFIDELAKVGVEHPGEPGWMVKLPNGITIECRLEGEASQFTAEGKPAKPAGTVKKQTPGDKRRAAAANGSSSARAKKDVKPNPKKATAKKATARKPAAKKTPAKVAAKSTRSLKALLP